MPSINKTTLRELIAGNQAQYAIEHLRSSEQVLRDAGLMREITLILAQWQACRQEHAGGRSAPEAYRAENQRINNALLQFIDELRRNPDWAGVPGLVITSKDLSADERLYLQRTTEWIVQKGELDRSDLLATIAKTAGEGPQTPAGGDGTRPGSR